MTDNYICPSCGVDKLDSGKTFNHETQFELLGEDGINRKVERWKKMYCAECDLVFAVRKRFVNITENEINDKDQ